ncbi:MAG: prephenate dehydratase [Eggerthellaceae bacterium]|jgi:prephenate dehydratase
MTTANATLAYLGPEGTYSNEAALVFQKRLGLEESALIPCSSFGEVFDFVDRGRCTYGVVATENSLEGVVTATLDNFAFSTSTTIFGKVVIDIHHCLIINPDAEIGDITTIASHPQGLGQCRRYLAEHFPGRKTITTSSTAESVALAIKDPHIASIANEFAANIYGGKIYAREIEDRYSNQTSFALIGRANSTPPYQGEHYKTSLALFLREDRAGALLMILSEFAYAGINLTLIQSRPTKQQLGDYMFFVDIEGSVDEPRVQTALNCLRLKLREVKVLGCYPVD